MKLTRIMLNQYENNFLSFGFDLGFVLTDNSEKMIESLQKHFEGRKEIQGMVFEKSVIQPVSIQRMSLKILSHFEGDDLDYIENNTEKTAEYRVTLHRKDEKECFDHILDFGEIYTSKDKKLSEEEIIALLLKDMKTDLDGYKVKIKKINHKELKKFIEKVEDIIF